jgi:hypothetical protein
MALIEYENRDTGEWDRLEQRQAAGRQLSVWLAEKASGRSRGRAVARESEE